jgi:hypothetical protein
MEQRKPVGFRRIHGRVIPIFNKDKAAKGAAVGAGVATAGYAVAKYPNPIKNAAVKVAKFGSKVTKALPLPAKLAIAGAAVGASTQIKLKDEYGQPVKLKITKEHLIIAKKVGFGGAGFGLAATAGRFASHLDVKGAHAFHAAKEALKGTTGLPLFEAAGVAKHGELLGAAKVIAKSRAGVVTAGIVGGGYLASKAFETKEKDKFQLRAKGIGVLVAGAAAAGYYSGINPALKGMKLLRVSVEKAFTMARKMKP